MGANILPLVRGDLRVHPHFMIIEPGANASYVCKSRTVDVMWTFNGEKLPNNTFTEREYILGFHYLYLEIAGVKLENDGSYECYGHDEDYFRFKGVVSLTVKSMKCETLMDCL